MIDVPERIWVFRYPDTYENPVNDEPPKYGPERFDEYLRADIAAARIAALEADLARARERVEALEREIGRGATIDHYIKRDAEQREKIAELERKLVLSNARIAQGEDTWKEVRDAAASVVEHDKIANALIRSIDPSDGNGVCLFFDLKRLGAVNGTCPTCGGDTVDGVASWGCDNGDVECETCGARPCSGFC
jgi:hypothetical protein